MRIGFRKNADYVAVRTFLRPGAGVVRAGDSVKGSVPTLRRFYRRKKIGIVGHPWTEARLNGSNGGATATATATATGSPAPSHGAEAISGGNSRNRRKKRR